MKRRGFLGALLAVPLGASLAFRPTGAWALRQSPNGAWYRWRRVERATPHGRLEEVQAREVAGAMEWGVGFYPDSVGAPIEIAREHAQHGLDWAIEKHYGITSAGERQAAWYRRLWAQGLGGNA